MEKKEMWEHAYVPLKKILMLMKLTAVFLMFGLIQVSAIGFGQNARLNLDLKNQTIRNVLAEIEKTTNFRFFYSEELVHLDEVTSISIRDKKISYVLDALFENQPITYEMLENNLIALKPTVRQEDHQVSGKVTDSKGMPLPGVTILVKETNVGTVTNPDGQFSLKIPTDGKIIVISFVGMKTQEITLDGRDSYLIKMEESIEMIDDVVVTGFQTISRERATGSFAKVTVNTIEKRPTTNLSNALIGQVAGLVSDPNTGFVIRGRSSLSGASDRLPLLVVDGFPIEGGFTSINPNDVKSVDVLKDAAATSIYGARAANGVIVITTKSTGPKGRINVNYNSFVSIGENIDLDYYMNMADAKSQMDYEDRFWSIFKGTTSIPDPYTTSTGTFRGRVFSEYSTLLHELNKGYITQEYFDKQKQRMLTVDYKDDFQKYLLRNSVNQQHNLILSGTGEKNSYKFSALYENDLTNYRFNNNNKIMLSFTNIYNISKGIKYTLSSNLTSYNNANNGVSMGTAKSVMSPWTRIFDDTGNYTRMNFDNYEPLAKIYEPRLPYSTRYNILEEATLSNNTYKGLDLRLQNEFEFRLTSGLTFRPMFQYELFSDESVSIYDEKMYASRMYANMLSTLDATTGKYLSQIPKGGIYRKNSDTRRESYKFRAQADYSKTFDGKHEIVALAGTEIISTYIDYGFPEIKFGYSSKGLNYALFDYNVNRLDLFQNQVYDNSYAYDGNLIYNYKASAFAQAYRYNERYLAGFANASYTFDKKYTLTASARTDASNFVAKTIRDKFSPFYSFGLRWNMKNEKFLSGVDFVDRLAFRATYGVTGIAAGKRSLLAVTVFTSQPPTSETGNLPNGYLSGRDNDFLTWEKTYATDLGLDFSLFKGKLTGVVDAYRRYSKDLLTQVPTSLVIQSISSLTMNFGELVNKGLEVSLGTDLNITKDLTWSSDLNFDYNFNKVLNYKYIYPQLFYYLGSNFRFIEGYPTDGFFMVKLVGTSKDGYYIQEEKNGELVEARTSSTYFSSFSLATISGLNPSKDNRIYYMGRTTPPATLGFTNSLSWKGFTLMAVVTGRFGYKFTRTDEVMSYSLSGNNISATGLAVLQPVSTTATTNTGNIMISKTNLTMLSNLNSLRNYYSTAVVEDASHIRLNEIYLGYQLPEHVLGIAGKLFRSATVYTQLRNAGLLWKGTDSKSDPEYRIGTIKPVRTYTFGVRIGL